MKGRIALVLIAAALMVFAGYAALYVAPDEKTMHAIQRIFYFHVPSAICSFVAFFVVFIANFAYLGTRKPKWDWLGVAGAEVGVVCSTIVLITGPIWAHPVWGIWWTWDARLTTTFVLWLLYISYLLLRGMLEDSGRRATLSAIFGIFAFLDVPLVYVSNRLWRTQHPQPVILGGENSGLDPRMGRVLLLCVVAISCVMVLVLVDRYRLGILKLEWDDLQMEAESGGLYSPNHVGEKGGGAPTMRGSS
jgi:heme exporter protein C